MADGVAPAVTRDAFYGGRLILTQPAKGHRSGTDAVLLAAAVASDFDGVVVDLGAGVGAVGLGVALACPKARVRLIEIDADMARLAAANIAANGLEARVSVTCADALSRGARRAALLDAADLVLTNPPFRDSSRVRSSPDLARRAAHVLPAGAVLDDWVVAGLDCLKAKGTLIAIHAADALGHILAALDRRAGAVTVKCVHPRADAPAHRVLVRARKGSRAPLAIAPPLVLHEGEGFTPEADELHRGLRTIAGI